MIVKINMHIWMFIIFLLITVTRYSVVMHEYNPDGWQLASTWLKSTMNEGADPCEDFVEFACGKFETMYGKSRHQVEVARVAGELSSKLLSAISKIDMKNPHSASFKKSLKIFYQQCQNETAVLGMKKSFISEVYNNFMTYLVPQIDEVDDLISSNATSEHFWKFVGMIQKVLGTAFVIEAEVLPRTVDCTTEPLIHLRPTARTQWNELLEGSMLESILEYIAEYHNKTFDLQDVSDTKSKIGEFQEQLASLRRASGDTHSESSIDLRQLRAIKYNDLKQKYPNIEWDAYFRGLMEEEVYEKYLVQSNPYIILEYEKYFENLTHVIDSHDHTTTTNVAFVSAMINYVLFFHGIKAKKVDRREFDYSVLEGNTCLDLTVRYFSTASLRLLCEEYKIDVENWRNDFLQIKDLIFSSLRFLIQSTDWMDESEKMVLVERVNQIVFYGDIPSWIMDDEAVNRKTPKYHLNYSLIANDILAQQALSRQQMLPLLSGVMDDAPPTFTQNAWNDIKGIGSIRFTVGYQMPPYYMYSYPLAVKFGAMGRTMGHELMHSFVTALYLSKFYYKDMPYRNVPDRLDIRNDTLDMIGNKTLCMVPYYNTYCESEASLREHFQRKNQTCNIGLQNYEENIADTEGIKIAYNAYKFATQTMGSEPLLNDLTEYSADQLFFMAFARRTCAYGASLGFQSPEDGHSSIRARIEQPLMNFPPFAKSFGCRQGQRYFRNETCSVYGNAMR